jgi:hypothetical protein
LPCLIKRGYVHNFQAASLHPHLCRNTYMNQVLVHKCGLQTEADSLRILSGFVHAGSFVWWPSAGACPTFSRPLVWRWGHNWNWGTFVIFSRHDANFGYGSDEVKGGRRAKFRCRFKRQVCDARKACWVHADGPSIL